MRFLGEGFGGGLLFTHVLTVARDVDIRDGGRLDSQGLQGVQDSIYVPNQSGTKFTVLWVERLGNYKRVYLQRQSVPPGSANI